MPYVYKRFRVQGPREMDKVLSACKHEDLRLGLKHTWKNQACFHSILILVLERGHLKLTGQLILVNW